MSAHDAVEVPGAIIDALFATATASMPHECCGLVIGRGRRVTQIYPATNLAAAATRFHIAPSDHFAALRAARAQGLAVIGAYHSHPSGPAVPSATDRAEAFENFLHLIVGFAPEQRLGAWHLVHGNFAPLDLVRT